MSQKTTKNNISQKGNKLEDKEFKVQLGDDGIVRVKVGRAIDEETAETLAKDFLRTVKKLPTKAKILIDLNLRPHVTTSLFRRKCVELIKDTFKDQEFEKMALWGGGVLQKTAISFVVTAAGLKNIKYFKTEEEAIKWLKEE